MARTLSDLLQTFEELWPVAGAEEWDRPGLVCGHPNQPVAKALLTVDVTLDVLEEAKLQGCDLVIAHHPVLLKGVSLLPETALKGELVSFAIKNSIAIYSAHTNADIVENGVSDVFSKALGLKNASPLVETGKGIGHGRLGELEEPVTLREFAAQIGSVVLKTKAPIRVAGDLDQIITRVAVVGGAGDSFIPEAQLQGAQVLVTSDLRHHVSVDAVSDPSHPIALIDVSHYGAEGLWLEPTKNMLGKLETEVDFLVSKVNTDPWSLVYPGLG